MTPEDFRRIALGMQGAAEGEHMAHPDFRNSIDVRSDLYTAALTAFEFATGSHPIARNADDAMETYRRAITVLPKSLKSLRPDFSEDFCKLIDQLLKKKPSLRPANFDSLFERTEATR